MTLATSGRSTLTKDRALLSHVHSAVFAEWCCRTFRCWLTGPCILLEPFRRTHLKEPQAIVLALDYDAVRLSARPRIMLSIICHIAAV
jgi:hypothetical protein